jgi:transcriptional regulator with XRE-family HTH domain
MRTLRLPDNEVVAIGVRLRELRLAYGRALSHTTALQWADFTDIANTAWANYEAGTRIIAVPEALKLAQKTGASFDWIYRGLEDTLPPNTRRVIEDYRRSQHRKRA